MKVRALNNRGRLLQSDGQIFGGRVFYVVNNTRHWVMDANWCLENGFVWPDDVEKVSDDDLLAVPLGRPVAPRVGERQPSPAVFDSLQMRSLACSFLRGSGIEIGAASNPLPIPLDCEVRYADLLTYEELLGRLYPGQSAGDMIKPTLQASIEDLSALTESVDFIATAHVIEHVRNPIGAIVHAATKIRKGGHLLLLIPDMTQTFDRQRALTDLQHLILDYRVPSDERDQAHFKEFYRDAFITPPEQYETVWTKAFDERFPIHYHTWTYESFQRMVEWIIETPKSFRRFWSHPTRGNEFCFVLKR